MENMKDFFEKCLRELHQLTGLKQYIEICNKPTKQEAEQEMNVIVRGMMMVSEKFSYIPQDAQKRIVRHQMVSDSEMYALNAKVVYKWFNAVAAGYWKESGHLETNELNSHEQNAVAFEDFSEETKKLWNDFKASLLAQGTIKEVPDVSDHELKRIQQEDDNRVKRTSISLGYKPPTKEDIEMRELKRQWMLETHELITGKPNKDFVEFEIWLKNKG